MSTEHLLTQTEKPPLIFALLLAMTMALGPLALDTYLPAFPQMAESLQVNVHEISLSISIYVFVLAFGQLVAGPLADKWGRSRVMLTGLAIFSGASLMLSLASSLDQLLMLRAAQAFGSGWAVVCVPALVRDRMSGQVAAKFFSTIGLIMIVAPAIAPAIGSFLLVNWNWSSIFLFLGGYALLVAVLLKLIIFNSRYRKPVVAQEISVVGRYAEVLKTKPALPLMLVGALSFSVMLLFITHASFIYQEHFGVGPSEFSMLFAANILFMVGMNLLNRRLLDNHKSVKILRWCLTLQFSGIVYLLVVSLNNPSLWLFLPGIVVTVGSMGAIIPNIQACFMEYFHHNGGTAAALFGATQFSLAGLISALSSFLPESLVAVVMAQGACSILSLTLILLRTKREKATNAAV